MKEQHFLLGEREALREWQLHQSPWGTGIHQHPHQGAQALHQNFQTHPDRDFRSFVGIRSVGVMILLSSHHSVHVEVTQPSAASTEQETKSFNQQIKKLKLFLKKY